MDDVGITGLLLMTTCNLYQGDIYGQYHHASNSNVFYSNLYESSDNSVSDNAVTVVS